MTTNSIEQLNEDLNFSYKPKNDDDSCFASTQKNDKDDDDEKEED